MSSPLLRTTVSLLLLQLFSRLFSFALNQFLLRSTSPAALGVATMSLEVLRDTSLFLLREGIRSAVIVRFVYFSSMFTFHSRRHVIEDSIGWRNGRRTAETDSSDPPPPLPNFTPFVPPLLLRPSFAPSHILPPHPRSLRTLHLHRIRRRIVPSPNARELGITHDETGQSGRFGGGRESYSYAFDGQMGG